MPRRSKSGVAEWIDPDDAPEITDEWLDGAQWEINGVPIDPPKRRGTVEVRLNIEAEVAAFFRTSESGWEGRVNEALRNVVRQV